MFAVIIANLLLLLIAARVASAAEMASAVPSNAELRRLRDNYFREIFAATKIQKLVRGFIAKRKYTLAVSSATKVQSVARRNAAKNRIRTANNAAVIIQKIARMRLVRKKYQRGLALAIKIQALARQRAQRKQYQAWRASFTKIQTLFRAAQAKKPSTNAWLAFVRQMLRSVGDFILPIILSCQAIILLLVEDVMHPDREAEEEDRRQEPNDGAGGGNPPDFEDMHRRGYMYFDEDFVNHYDGLGFSRDDDHETIKKTFRRLALLHHPDKGGDPAKFRPIAEAWKVLRDPARWAAYNRQYDFQYARGARVAGLVRRQPARVAGYLT